MYATEEANARKYGAGQDGGSRDVVDRPADSPAPPPGSRDLLLAVMALTVAGLRRSTPWSGRTGKETGHAACIH